MEPGVCANATPNGRYTATASRKFLIIVRRLRRCRGERYPSFATGSLIVQAKRKLHQPGGIELRTDDAERRVALRLARYAELDTVEDVEELRPELKFKTL